MRRKASKVEALIDTTCKAASMDEDRCCELAIFAMKQLGLPQDSEVSISFVDNDEIASLNEQYRGKVGPTDVLSFECDNLKDDFPVFEGTGQDGVSPDAGKGATYQLGDVIIASDVAVGQAAQYGNTPEEETEMLVVHGILHLCGYDHVEDDDAAEMEALQREVLASWRGLHR